MSHNNLDAACNVLHAANRIIFMWEKKMSVPCRVYAFLVVVVLAPSLRADDQPSAGSGLAALQRFVGEWEVDGKWADGAALHARGVYEWGLGKKIMTAKTFVRDGDKEYQRYEGVMAWHPDKKSLFQISFAFDGAVTEVLMETKEKDTLHIGWLPFSADKPSNVRQVIKFLDQDRFQWTVSMKEGESWKQLIDATWKRKGK
jgi:hypothetical protein